DSESRTPTRPARPHPSPSRSPAAIPHATRATAQLVWVTKSLIPSKPALRLHEKRSVDDARHRGGSDYSRRLGMDFPSCLRAGLLHLAGGVQFVEHSLQALPRGYRLGVGGVGWHQRFDERCVFHREQLPFFVQLPAVVAHIPACAELHEDPLARLARLA